MATNFINELLSPLKQGKKDTVYISITPEIGLEMAQINPETKTIVKYSSIPLEYNESLKEIKDYNQFKEALTKLFEELSISPKSDICLSIPTVHIGKLELPLILSDEMITEAIVSEVEQSYIFKRCEPIVSWTEVFGMQNEDSRTIVYSAIQKDALDAINGVFASIGANLAKLEVSLISILRSIAYVGDGESIKNDFTLMMINSTGYELIQMSKGLITDYYSEPLALKTYEYEEVYDAINTSAQIALLNYSVNKMLIISNTDMVSAEHLAEVIKTNGQTTYIENNNFKKKEIMPVSLDILPDKVLQISLNAIGVAAINIYDYPLKFNYLGNKGREQKEPIVINGYELTEPMLIRITVILGIALIVPCLLLFLITSHVQKSSKQQLNKLKEKDSNLTETISNLTSENSETTNDFDINNEINIVLRNNRTKLMNYSSIGESVPRNVWVTYFNTNQDGRVDIKGMSQTVEDIYIFYRNLKDSLINSQIKLQKLDMQSKSVEDAMYSSSNYEFEITNMTPQQDTNKQNDETASEADSESGEENISDLEEVEVN